MHQDATAACAQIALARWRPLAACTSGARCIWQSAPIHAHYDMAETNLSYINRNRNRNRRRPLSVLVLRLGILGRVVFGAFHDARLAWSLGDIGVGLMAWRNSIAILILQKPALLALRDYKRQKKAGLDLVFDPPPLGIKNADLWREGLVPPAPRGE
ncbi:alanine:cation symporter family protein [Xanthomonas translucens pv. graminis]|nr:alanine:cation symporter family protein [Xanthomonas translucens pv. graminis]